MKFKCNFARELLVSIVGISLLAFFLLPPITRSVQVARRQSCANNLRQLYRLGTTYASTHDGQWSDATGSGLWRSFAKTSPPLIDQDDLEVLICPLQTEEPIKGRCDYLGPRKTASPLKPGEALGACTHGRHDGDTHGSVLLKDGRVKEYEFTHPIWSNLAP